MVKESSLLPILSLPLSLMYSFNLSFHFLNGLPLLLADTLSLTQTHLFHSIYSSSFQCNQIISKYSFSPILPLNISLHPHILPNQISHSLLQASLVYLVTSHAPLRTISISNWHMSQSTPYQSVQLLTEAGGGASGGVGGRGSGSGDEKFLVRVQQQAMKKPKCKLMVQDSMNLLFYSIMGKEN